jgi:diacylglycerol kinase family enzyme
LRVTIEGNPTRILTPLLFVGNNAYSLDPGALGQRRSLQDGLLSVHALKNCTRIGLLAFAARLLVGRVNPERDFALVGEGAAVTVEAHARAIALGVDGEYVRLQTPLQFRIRPGALSVIVPQDAS